MSDKRDIVERLRDAERKATQGMATAMSVPVEDTGVDLLAQDAADEIQLLRQDNARLRNTAYRAALAVAICAGREKLPANYTIQGFANDVLEEDGDVAAALSATAVASPWRPIETAPENEIVDLWDGRQRWTDMMWDISTPKNPHGAWRKANSDWRDAISNLSPTHWMPLPPAPDGSG